VLKPEILLAAGLTTGAAVVIRLLRPGRNLGSSAAAWAAAAALPTLAFWAYFAAKAPSLQALGYACRAWFNVIGPHRLVDPVLQGAYLGFDHAWTHLKEHVYASLLAILLFAGIAAGARAVDRAARTSFAILAGALLAGAVFWLASREIAWSGTGRCLAILCLVYLVHCAVALVGRVKAGEDISRQALRCLVAVLAFSMMARMILNGRINQFGFYQAALAGILVPAVLIGEMPDRLGLGLRGRTAFVALTILLFGTGTGQLVAGSQNLLRQRTFSVGDGVDRFLTMPPDIEATGALVKHFSDYLRQRGAGQTLLVLPEGEMINYLARMPSPAAPFFFFSVAIQGPGEREIRDELATHPPDWIVVISRDLREYGIARYGESPGHGQLIIDWTRANCHVVDSLGGDPLDFRQRGGVLLVPDSPVRPGP
jgi:hypothetical protein